MAQKRPAPVLTVTVCEPTAIFHCPYSLVAALVNVHTVTLDCPPQSAEPPSRRLPHLCVLAHNTLMLSIYAAFACFSHRDLLLHPFTPVCRGCVLQPVYQYGATGVYPLLVMHSPVTAYSIMPLMHRLNTLKTGRTASVKSPLPPFEVGEDRDSVTSSNHSRPIAPTRPLTSLASEPARLYPPATSTH